MKTVKEHLNQLTLPETQRFNRLSFRDKAELLAKKETRGRAFELSHEEYLREFDSVRECYLNELVNSFMAVRSCKQR